MPTWAILQTVNRLCDKPGAYRTFPNWAGCPLLMNSISPQNSTERSAASEAFAHLKFRYMLQFTEVTQMGFMCCHVLCTTRVNNSSKTIFQHSKSLTYLESQHSSPLQGPLPPRRRWYPPLRRERDQSRRKRTHDEARTPLRDAEP